MADALSRVPTKRVESKLQYKPLLNFESSTLYAEDPELAECLFHDPEIAECFLEHPVFDDKGRLPFQFDTLHDYQNGCAELQSMPNIFPDRFVKVQFNQTELICFRQNDVDRIVLTHELLPKVIKYYHESMAHAEGAGRLSKSIRQHFHHKDIEKQCKQHVQECTKCAKARRGGRVYGESAPRDASVMPWQEVHCDSIGPWKIDLRARTLTFHAMTMIDPGTNLVEIKQTLSTTAAEGAAAVENTWLSRYPKPLRIITDQGPEFSTVFTDMCKANGIKHSTSSSRNSHGNPLIERIHQTIRHTFSKDKGKSWENCQLRYACR